MAEERARHASPLPKDLSEEAAMGMPMDEVMGLPMDLGDAEWWRQVQADQAAEPDWELVPSPRGVGLPAGAVGAGPALEAVYHEEKAVKVWMNTCSERGVRTLVLVRLGRAIDAELYVAQIFSRDVVGPVSQQAWVDRSSGQVMFYLLLVWREA